MRRIVEDRIAESIVSGIARAARTLGISSIAEHVENAATADKLRELDVDFGQGFYFGRPQAFASLVRNLGARPRRPPHDARLTDRRTPGAVALARIRSTIVE